jgi:FkbM family methyltransferase
MAPYNSKEGLETGGRRAAALLESAPFLRRALAAMSALALLLVLFPPCREPRGALQLRVAAGALALDDAPLDADLEDAVAQSVAQSAAKEEVEAEAEAEAEADADANEGAADGMHGSSGLKAVDPATQVFIGGRFTGWTVDSRCFKNKARLVGYGVGCGEDITWDIGMTTRYNVEMFLFDPTPKSIKYMKPLLAKHTDKMHLTEEGLSDKEGVLTFRKPKDKFVSLTAFKSSSDPSQLITLKVNTLDNFMAKFGHTYLDILKIDIEGSEYGVLDQLIERRYFPFTQLLVEYHSRFFESAEGKRRQSAVDNGLKAAGFTIFHHTAKFQEVSYIKKADLDYCINSRGTRNPYVN